jgi:hypothetical protein
MTTALSTRTRAMIVAVIVAIGLALAPTRSRAGEEDPAQAAFSTVARVLRHPRCLNCHTNTQWPRVGNDRERHPQNVSRGKLGMGVPALRCSTCHQRENQDLVGIPGAPHWVLAPLAMGWEGLDDHDLAEAIKDPKKNGGRSLEEQLEHLAGDALVGWAWEPGAGRSAPPLSREQMVEAMRTWIEAGAPSPPAGIISY